MNQHQPIHINYFPLYTFIQSEKSKYKQISILKFFKLWVVKVEFFEPVFPFSRFSVAKTPLALTNHWPSTGLREYGQKVFLTPGVKKTHKPVQKNPLR